jgi:hypothetical protein
MLNQRERESESMHVLMRTCVARVKTVIKVSDLNMIRTYNYKRNPVNWVQ